MASSRVVYQFLRWHYHFFEPDGFRSCRIRVINNQDVFHPPALNSRPPLKVSLMPKCNIINNRYFCWGRIIFFIPHHSSTMFAVGKYITGWIGIYKVSQKEDIGWIWDLNIRTVIIVHDVIFQDDLVCIKGWEPLSPVFPDDIMANYCILHTCPRRS